MTHFPIARNSPTHFALLLFPAMLLMVVLGSCLPYEIRGADVHGLARQGRRNPPVRPGPGAAR